MASESRRSPHDLAREIDDRILRLRLFAFKNFRYDYRGDRADFLSEYTEAVTEGKISFELEKARAIFTKTFLILGSTLGENAFTLVNMKGAFGFHFVDDHFEPFTQALQTFLHKIDFASSSRIDQVGVALVSAKQSPSFSLPVGRPYLVSGTDLQARIEIVERELGRHLSV